jgi:hypothetical protein
MQASLCNFEFNAIDLLGAQASANYQSMVNSYATSPVNVKNYSTNRVSIYPNPTSGRLIINLEKGISSIAIKNNLGQNLFKNYPNSKDKLELDISTYPSGIYFLHLKFEDEVIIKKVIKE